MENKIYSCPGKVFILGEYACLKGTSALVGTFLPRFELKLLRKKKHEIKILIPFHKDSPAGKLLLNNQELLSEYTLQWMDPYKTPIGVGSSSAQFLLSLNAVRDLKKKKLSSQEDILKEYWHYNPTHIYKPSGCDVMAQLIGGITVIKNEPLKTKSVPLWRDESSSFLLAFTGEKVKTHEQLKELYQKGFPHKYAPTLSRLDNLVLNGISAWERENPELLGKVINQYQQVLHTSLVSTSYHSLIESIQSLPFVYGCKGSGAQGGDSLLILYKKKEEEKLKDFLKRNKLEIYKIQWSERGFYSSS
ncbi:MAG: hypothetical protein HYW47_00375 [Deltaproteobacteria bacterium]|nr:hypothetical protein [Deltaproteobacteria bacterium]